MNALTHPRHVARALAATLVVTLLAAACGSGSAAPSAAPAASKTPAAAATTAPAAPTPTAGPPAVVNIATAANILAAPLWVGVEKGIYLKNGVDLKVNPVASGADGLKGMQGGTYDIVTNAWASIAPAIVQGVDVKIIGAMSGRSDVSNWDPQLSIIVRPGVTAAKPADLKGLTIGVALGTATENWLRAHLRSGGLDADKDVKIVNMPALNALSVIQSKAVDAAATAEPFGSQTLVGVPGSTALLRGGGIVDARTSLFLLNSWLQKNQSAASRFLAGHIEAMQYVRQNPAETAKILTRYLSGLDEKVLTEALKYIDFDPRWGDKITAGFETASDTLVTAGTIKTKPKVADALALDALNAALKANPGAVSDLKY